MCKIPCKIPNNYAQLLTSLKQHETFPNTREKDNHGVYHEKKTLLVQCKYVADRWLFLIHAICALNLMLKYFCHLNPDRS